jgi:hypothetical protein
MEISKEITDELLNPEASKALATSGPRGLNVVPVSSINVVDNTIWLIDYFMDKTRENIIDTKSASLVCWSGLEGHQLNTSVSYLTKGEKFDQATNWIAQVHPTRTVQGLIVLEPTEIHDIGITNKV